MASERSRLRALLTARGDFWDLRWDAAQLERAWRNEVVTYPVCFVLSLCMYFRSRYLVHRRKQHAKLVFAASIERVLYCMGQL